MLENFKTLNPQTIFIDLKILTFIIKYLSAFDLDPLLYLIFAVVKI